MEKTNLKGLTLKELQSFFDNLGFQKFRAKQLYDWMYNQLKCHFEEMTNLPLDLRSELSRLADITAVNIKEVNTSQIDGTKKVISELADEVYIETAIMRHSYGNTICISSQVGCKMGCGFCASHKGGLIRNLQASELVDQIVVGNSLLPEGEKINNVVVMGIGEPLENYQNLLKFISIINHSNGLNIGQRNITVSTCGLVPEIFSLAKEQLQITLAVSLHAPYNELRNKLMPINRKYPLEDLIPATKHYFLQTGRRITFEYVLMAGVNDSKKEITELVNLLKGLTYHVNIIPMNDVGDSSYHRPSKKVIKTFATELEKHPGASVTVREERGTDISGACGQLRRRYAHYRCK